MNWAFPSPGVPHTHLLPQARIELAIDVPIKNSIVVGDAADEGAIFHCVDVIQAFVDRRKGGETGVKSVQSIRGPETWKGSNALPGRQPA